MLQTRVTYYRQLRSSDDVDGKSLITLALHTGTSSLMNADVW